MKRILVMLLCVSIMFTFLAACGSTSDNKGGVSGKKTEVKISCWGIETDPNSVIIKDAVELFNKKNNMNAVATVVFTEQEQYKTKIAAEMAANEVPDVFNTWAAGFLKPFVKAGKVYDLTDKLNSDKEWKDRYVPGVYTPLEFDGKVYALPTTQTVVCLFYNKEIFDRYGLKEPKTFDELKNIINVLNENGITPFALGNKAPWVGAMFSELVVNRVGGSEPYNKVYNGTGSWEDPAFIEAGKIMQELVDMKAFPEGFNALDNDPAQADFIAGKSAMLVMGSWAIQQLYTDMQDKLGVCKFPEITGGKGNADTWLGQPDQSFAIAAKSNVKDAAAEFIKTISDPEIQTKLSEAGNLVATNIEPDPDKVNPVAMKVGELLKDMKELFVFYDVGLGATIGNEYNNTIQAITAGQSVEESFKALQQFTEQNRED
ncbi:MAG: extracellular solute-binding protein [Acetivibrionales bacterium]|jgi:raffinose/stachyose/melibiose transport system substrate-binding protein|nr:extracellular solute-binding protein [Clostridiaceae bacterium]HOA54912.1 extracellular solute-binding protein [Clostridiales bacterium]HPZ06276.1 extracellular solute-binding protein [Clostridiales bacterium]HQD31413.1 extracellular solute-binding protein [Clostridiales bacterium]